MADDTAKAESAQALFCAMADYLGSTKAKKVLDYKTYPTYSLFKSNNKKLITDSFSKIKTTGVGLELIEKILWTLIVKNFGKLQMVGQRIILFL